MVKKCGFCSYTTEDEAAFGVHMSTVHGWGAPAPAASAGATTAIAPPAADGVPKFCGNCGAPRDSESTNFCRNCGTPFVGAGAAMHQQASLAFAAKAGFWRRAGAYLLDTIVVLVLGFLVGVVVGVVGFSVDVDREDLDTIAQLIGNVLGVAYFVFFWSKRGHGQTPGMKRLGIKLVRTDGSYISLARAFMRNVAWGISAIVFGLGLLWVVWDKDKQGWHDKMVDTYVVRV